MEASSILIGIDVSKAQLDIRVRPTGMREKFSNDKAGIKALVERLSSLKPVLIVLEATGNLERAVARALVSGGFPLTIVNPRQVRDFARATGQLAKTDSINADVLAHFAEVVHPQIRALPDPASWELKDLIARRRQISAMIVTENNRFDRASKTIARRISAHIRWLEKELQRADHDLDQSSGKARSGRPTRTCFKLSPASVRSPVAPCSRNCQNLGNSIANRSLHWPVWRRLTATAARSKASAVSGVAVPLCAPLCTWLPWWLADAMPWFESSTIVFALLAKNPRWPWSSACVNS